MPRSSALPVCLAICLAITANAPSMAGGATDWHRTMGGDVRIVLESATATDQGRLPATVRGAIEIKLDEGWHTYWRDPGASGIPPMFQWSVGSDIQDATIHYPAPKWVEDDYGGYAGYTQPVTLPIVFETGGAAKANLKGMLLLGICEIICIPVALPFDVEIQPSNVSALTDLVVRNAFELLPKSMPSDAIAAEFRNNGFVVSFDAISSHIDETEIDAVFVHLDGAQVSYPKRLVRDDGSIAFETKINNYRGDATSRLMSITAVAGEKAYETLIDVQLPVQRD